MIEGSHRLEIADPQEYRLELRIGQWTGHRFRHRVATGHGRAASKASLLPHGADAFGLEAFDRIQDHPPRPTRVRRQVQAAEYSMDEKACRVEHLSEFRQGVRTDRGGELPRSLPIDDHLAGLKTPPEQVERCVLKDDCPVVARLPALRRHPPYEAVAIEQLHQELAARPEGASDSPQDSAIFLLPIKKPERGEHRDRRIEGAPESQATHVPLDEGGLDAGAARGFPSLGQEGRREVESRDAVPALREADRMAARAAPDVQDAPPFPEVQDLVDRLDLRRRLRMDVSDQVIGPEEVLVPSLRDLCHRTRRTACAGKILPRSLLLDPGPGFPLDRGPEMFEVRDHRVFASGLQELDDRLDLRPHAARGELTLCKVLPPLGGREPIEEPLARLAEVEGDPRDVRRDHA